MLIERSLFREKAAANSCQACGGVVSIVHGKRQCRYCGQQPGKREDQPNASNGTNQPENM
ncbi:MAG: hypothetical protein N2Z22_03160 [Turneriella sp.]|nr:hypothetical protein [Turneriella sp.]